MTAADQPWVLLRKGRPPLRFATCAQARQFYDGLRHNAGVREDAALFGPGGEAWYCLHWRSASWYRDDVRRARAPLGEPPIAAPAGEDAA